MHSQIDACRVCGNSQLVMILDLGEQRLTGVFPRERTSHVDSGPLRLVKCHGSDGCGLVQLEHTFSFERMYGDNYGYRSGLNPTMVRHLHSKVKRILNQIDLPEGAAVVDIGSNDGTTLDAFPDHLLRVGVDPTASKFLEFYPSDVRVVADFFSKDLLIEALASRKPSVITSISMFYDLPHPLQFMQDIHDVLAPGGVWVFEQSYLPLMLERNSYDTVCHEHLEYYTLSQVTWMAKRVGFSLIDVEFNDVNGGSFSVTAGKIQDGFSESPQVSEIVRQERASGVNDLEIYTAFADRVSRHRANLLDFIATTKKEGKSLGGLGASTKGNVLLQYCGLTANDLIAIGEVNEEKFGAFTPGTLIPIWPEERLMHQNVDYLMVLPWHFRETFLAKKFPGDTKLVFPLPELEVVDASAASTEDLTW